MKVSTLSVHLLLAALACGCAPSASTSASSSVNATSSSPPPSKERGTGTGGNPVITAVPAAKMRSFVVDDGTWLPNDEDVLAFESGLDAFVRSRPEAAAISAKLGEYAVQYHGVTNREQKVLRADFVCQTSGKDPSSEVVSVKGGAE